MIKSDMIRIIFISIFITVSSGLSGCLKGNAENAQQQSDTIIPNNLRWSERMALTIMKKHPQS